MEFHSYIHWALFLKIITLSRYTIFSVIVSAQNNFEIPLLVEIMHFSNDNCDLFVIGPNFLIVFGNIFLYMCMHRKVFKNMEAGSKIPVLKFHLYQFLPVRTWTSYLTHLCIDFFLYISVPNSQKGCKDQMIIHICADTCVYYKHTYIKR